MVASSVNTISHLTELSTVENLLRPVNPHYADIRRKAIEVHRTQYSPFERMPTPELEAGLLNQDFFILVDPPVPEGQTGIFRNRSL